MACQLTCPPLSSAFLCSHLDKWHILHNIPPIYIWHHLPGLREAQASALPERIALCLCLQCAMPMTATLHCTWAVTIVHLICLIRLITWLSGSHIYIHLQT